MSHKNKQRQPKPGETHPLRTAESLREIAQRLDLRMVVKHEGHEDVYDVTGGPTRVDRLQSSPFTPEW